MDPVSLILGALAAGALAAVQEDATQAVKDAYAGLKHLLLRRLRGNQPGELALTRYEQQPAAWEPPLRAELTAIEVDCDDEVLAAARTLIEELGNDPVGAKIYQNQFHGPVHGLVQGDHNQVSMKFDNRDQVV